MTPTPAQHDVAVSLDTAAEYLLAKLTNLAEFGPWEVLVEPYGDGRLPTSTGLEDAIRRRAQGLIPPTVVRGLNVGLKGYQPARGGPVEAVLFSVEGVI